MQTGLKPAHEKVLYSDLSRVRAFEVTRSNGKLTPLQREILGDLAGLRMPFPCTHNISAGRSAYAETLPDSHWRESGIRAVKGKGNVGLKKLKDGTFRVEIPRPDIRYGTDAALHIIISPEMEVGYESSQPKALHALTLKGADNEFDCQSRLQNAGVGFDSLMAVGFRKEGRPYKDFQGRPSGAVFIQNDPDFGVVRDYQNFLVTKVSGGFEIVRPRSGHLDNQSITLTCLVDNFIAFNRKIAETKSKGFILAGVGRHSSHGGNFLFKTTTEQTFMADTDSSLLMEGISKREKGAQLVRDVSTSLLRSVQDLGQCVYSQAYCRGLEFNLYQPFAAFLEGFFSGLARKSEISACAEAIHEQYVEFLHENSEELAGYSHAYRQGRKAGDSDLLAKSEYLWHASHQSFLKVIIPAVYDLARVSRLSPFGIEIPKIKDAEVLRRVSQGIDAYVERLYLNMFADGEAA